MAILQGARYDKSTEGLLLWQKNESVRKKNPKLVAARTANELPNVKVVYSGAHMYSEGRSDGGKIRYKDLKACLPERDPNVLAMLSFVMVLCDSKALGEQP